MNNPSIFGFYKNKTMKDNHHTTLETTSILEGNYHPKIKRLQGEPRKKIRQLLRSFEPLGISRNQRPGKDIQK
jgi:hypothetical protein